MRRWRARRAPVSLSLRLVATIGLSLVLLWSGVAVWMFIGMRGELRQALDERLAASARMVAGLMSRLPAQPLQAQALLQPTLEVVARDAVACEVSLLRGEVTLHTVARTAASPGLDDAAPGFSTRVINGRAWRTFVLQQGELRIATADRLERREELLRGMALSAAVPFVVAVSASLLLLWLGVRSGLRPLDRLRKVLAGRSPHAVEPLPDVALPPELRPLVDTLGRLLARVQEAMARERRFTDDAAHELRTPLTAIKTHLQVLRLSLAGRPVDAPTARALDSAEAGVLRLQRTIDQLLLLARLEQADDAAPVRSDAVQAARTAMEEALAAAAAPAQRIALRVEPGMRPVWVEVPEPLLVSALRNLLDNALRHAPSGSPVQLRLASPASGRVELAVLDEGPGLTPADAAQATQRFWRRPASAGGSGLGLAIVDGIARRYGGELSLVPRPTGGLEARLSLHCHDPHAARAA